VPAVTVLVTLKLSGIHCLAGYVMAVIVLPPTRVPLTVVSSVNQIQPHAPLGSGLALGVTASRFFTLLRTVAISVSSILFTFYVLQSHAHILHLGDAPLDSLDAVELADGAEDFIHHRQPDFNLVSLLKQAFAAIIAPLCSAGQALNLGDQLRSMPYHQPYVEDDGGDHAP